jgi:hypothetical protein
LFLRYWGENGRIPVVNTASSRFCLHLKGINNIM